MPMRFPGHVLTSLCGWQRATSRRAISSTATTRPEIYDVVCVGGGPAGLSLLNALRSNPRTAGLKLALIEGQDLGDARSDKADLSGIGAWSSVDQSRIQPYHEIKVWDGVSGSSVNFNPSDNAFAASLGALFPGPKSSAAFPDGLATMIENSNLTSALAGQVLETPQIRVFGGSRVRDIRLGEESADLDLRSWPIVSIANSDHKMAARLLVGADGANSPVRIFAEINSRGWDYNRYGVVATLRLSSRKQSPVSTAYQRFLPTGPVAMLPLPGDHASLVWSTTPDRAAKLRSLAPRDFVAMVNAAFRLLPVDLDYLHTMSEGQEDEVSWRRNATMIDPRNDPADVVEVQPNSIASFPLRMRHVDTYVGERVALIGDAAHSIHPLAGQGLNQGLGDAQALAQSISHALQVGRDIGSCWTLDEYNAAQWPRNNAMLGIVDKLHKIYSVSTGPVVWARSLGLDTVDKLGWLKGFFMRRAAGVK